MVLMVYFRIYFHRGNGALGCVDVLFGTEDDEEEVDWPPVLRAR